MLLVLLLLLCDDYDWAVVVVHAFAPHSTITTRSITTRLSLQLPTNPNNSDNTFNPYTTATNTNRVSVRDQRLQELLGQLLRVPHGEARQSLLAQHRDFVLEPLEHDDDATTSSSSTRAERYRAYRQTLEARIGQARQAGTRDVLQALYEFVVANE